MSPASSRILFIRPDTYGDLVLFEPVLRLLRERLPQSEVAVVIREGFVDLAPLLAPPGVRWLTTSVNPYAEGLREAREAFEELVEKVREFSPDCIVAACFEQTWLEPAIAARFPRTRQIRLGDRGFDVVVRAMIDAETGTDWGALYNEKVPAEPDLQEWEKNLLLARALLGEVGERPLPSLAVPESVQEEAAKLLADARLERGNYVFCAAAGTANVAIKTWPVEGYAEVVAWLEREHGMRSLLVGHAREASVLEAVRAGASACGASPAVWLGQNGQMPLVAALAKSARIYFGNDTGSLHVAAAVGRPVAAIFGGGHWPRFKPAARRSAVVVQPMPCFGCGWNCIFSYAPCVREIPDEPVRRALRWLLSSDAAASQEFVVEGVIAAAGARLVAGAAEKRRAGQAALAGGGAGVHESTVGSLMEKLATSEADRAARQQVIEQQGEEITRLKADLAHWIGEADALWPRVNDAENARNLAAAQLEEIRGHFAASERDREARGRVVKEQGAEIARLQSEVDRWVKEAGALWPRVNDAENARNLLSAQLDDLRGQFAASEADREARLRVIEQQGEEVARLQQAVDRWLREAGELWPRVNSAESERDLLTVKLEDLRRELVASEAERNALKRILDEQRAEFTRRLDASEQHWTSRAAKALRLRRNEERGI